MWKKLYLSILLAGAILVTNLSPLAAKTLTPGGKTEAEVIQVIDQNFKTAEKQGGLAITIFKGNDTIYEEYRGFANKEKALVIDKDTVFEWGSITKLFVWVSAMQLSEAGKLDLQQDLREILPKDFFKRLRYDEPITMINLMNHEAGWQDILVGLFTVENNMLSLEESLQRLEPIQIERPGVVSAYSNWGAALAGLIIEKVSGQPFAEYVKTHILEPLDMSNTALLPGLLDHAGVKAKRQEIEGYDGNGNLLQWPNPDIALYAAGQGTGTLKDLTRFAKALATTSSQNKLFKSPDTLKEFQQATLTYESYGLPRNAHGMWVTNFSVPTYGHSGGTPKFMSNILFDPLSGYGYVVVTNEKSSVKEAFNSIPQILFGRTNSEVEVPATGGEKFELEEGYYISGRSNFKEGFLKITSAFLTEKISKINDNEYQAKSFISTNRIKKNDFGIFEYLGKSLLVPMDVILTVTSNKLEDGRAIIHLDYYDAIQVGKTQVIVNNIMLILYQILLLYALMTFFGKLIILLCRGVKKVFKKELAVKGQFVKKLNRLQFWAATLTCLFMLNIALVFVNVSTFKPRTFVMIQLLFNIVLTLGILILAVSCFLKYRSFKQSQPAEVKLGKFRKVQYYAMLGMAILVAVNLIYWDLWYF